MIVSLQKTEDKKEKGRGDRNAICILVIPVFYCYDQGKIPEGRERAWRSGSVQAP